MRLLNWPAISFALLAVLLLPSSQVLAQQPENQRSPEQLMQMVAEIWTQHDTDKVNHALTEDGVYEDVALGEVKRGRAEIKAFLNEDFAAVPDFKVELTRVFSMGDVAGCEWVMSGTHTGDFTNLPATGKSFSVRGASIVVVEGEQIVHWSDYYDLYGFLEQLGVLAGQGAGE